MNITKKIISPTIAVVVGLTVGFATGAVALYAQWSGPPGTPPNPNADAPLNVGTNAQIKDGGLGVNQFSAFGNSYFAGTVGVGTVNPATALQVVGDVRGDRLCIGTDCRNSWPSGGSSQWVDGSGGDIYYNGGSVGIGTTDPVAPLDIAGSETAIRFDNGHSAITVHDGFGNFNIKSGVDDDNVIVGGTGGSFIRMDHGGYINLSIDETTANGGSFASGLSLTLDNDIFKFLGGRVGIGTSNPLADLDVNGNARIATTLNLPALAGCNTATQALGVNAGGQVYCNTTGGSDTDWSFFGLNIYRNTGNVGIGTTNPTSPLHVVGTGRFTSVVSDTGAFTGGLAGVGLTVSQNFVVAGRLVAGTGNALACTGYLHCLTGNTQVVGNLDVTGTVTGIAGPDFAYLSDGRLKGNVATIGSALDTVDKLRGVSYTWNENDEKTHLGVIAQEVEAVLPGLVNETDDGYKAVSYNELVPLLIEAVKELRSENEELDAENNALEARLETVEKKLGL